MFTAVLFKIKFWKKPRYLVSGERIMRMCLYNMYICIYAHSQWNTIWFD